MARRLSLLLIGVACALALGSVIAFASPQRRGSGHSSAKRTRACLAHHRRAARRARCRRRARQHSKSTTPALLTSPLPGALPAGATPAPAPTQSTSTPSGSSAPPTEATPPATPPSVPHVQVSAVEYSFTLSRTTVPAGKVIFEFVNNGQDEHNLNVLPAEGPAAAVFPTAQPKAVSDQAIVMRPGTYTMFCSLPEHEQKGMKATLVVE